MSWTAKDVACTGETRLRAFRDVLRRYELARKDANHDQRVSVRQCRYCFYFAHGVAGQAFTEYTCRGCGEDELHPNTAVPKLCGKCAVTFDACRHCGGSMEWELIAEPRPARRYPKKGKAKP
jgi:hypothetical protein